MGKRQTRKRGTKLQIEFHYAPRQEVADLGGDDPSKDQDGFVDPGPLDDRATRHAGEWMRRNGFDDDETDFVAGDWYHSEEDEEEEDDFDGL